MPMSQGFQERLFPILPEVIERFGTPFHFLDEWGMAEEMQRITALMRRVCPHYRNFLAAKANTYPAVLKLALKLKMGLDCSSEVELLLAHHLGAKWEDIFFTSNGTSDELLAKANGKCMLNLDDVSLIGRVPEPFPEFFCARYNPGPRLQLASVIGTPETCKYGVPHERLVDAYRMAMNRGAKRFAVHTMVVSNKLDWSCHAGTFDMMLGVVGMLEDELGIRCELVNVGGGLGWTYKPGQADIDFEQLVGAMSHSLSVFADRRGWRPHLASENGRRFTAPHGVFVSRCVAEKDGYCRFRYLETSAMAAIMRPPMYHSDDNPDGGYHHITVFEPALDEPVLVSVAGPACEDSDRYGWDRMLSLHRGQHAIVHDTGGHAIEMGNNYNNWPKPKVLMRRIDGQVEMIDPGETVRELVDRRFRYLSTPPKERIFTPTQSQEG